MTLSIRWIIAMLLLAVNSPGQTVFFDGFEDGNVQGAAIYGWTQQSVTGSDIWLANTSLTSYNRTPRSGAWNAFLKYGNTDWMFKSVTLTAGTNYLLAFYARLDATAGGNILASYGTSPSAAGMTNAIIASSPVTNGDYQLFNGTFIAAASGTFYIGIQANLNTWPWYVSLDDISLEELGPPDCAMLVSPADAQAYVPITTTLNWAYGGGETTGYKLFLGTDNPPSNIENGTDLSNVTTYDPVPDLNYLTTYYWKVVAYNTIGDAVDCPVWSFTTRPDPAITSFPHSESFDGTEFPPYGWTNVKTAGSGTPGTWDRQTAGIQPACAPQSGAGMARYNCYSLTNGTKGELATPPINFPEDDYEVSCWIYRDGSAYTSTPDLIHVYYNTTNSSSGGTLLGTVNRSTYLAPTVAASGWYRYSFDMPAGATGNGRYIIFEAVSAHGYNLFMDEVTIESIAYVWTGLASASWTDPGNWDRGTVPGGSNHVIIPSDPASDPDTFPIITNGMTVSCYDITLGTGAEVIVETGGTLNVTRP